MDNLPRPTGRAGAVRAACREPHTWVISLLYIGTFGSFIGSGFAFGQVLQIQFADQFATPAKAAYLTFLGPLIGSLTRPIGGRLAHRLGGARVTVWSFAAMALGAAGVLAASWRHSLPGFVGFIAAYLVCAAVTRLVYQRRERLAAAPVPA